MHVTASIKARLDEGQNTRLIHERGVTITATDTMPKACTLARTFSVLRSVTIASPQFGVCRYQKPRKGWQAMRAQAFCSRLLTYQSFSWFTLHIKFAARHCTSTRRIPARQPVKSLNGSLLILKSTSLSGRSERSHFCDFALRGGGTNRPLFLLSKHRLIYC